MASLIRTLVAVSGFSENEVRTIIEKAPDRYKTYPILKRNGGERIIAQPAREVKFLQRIFMEEFLAIAPIHCSAMAYREGLSIRDNAAAHVMGNAILKFDFKEFFPSIISTDWESYCHTRLIFEDIEDVKLSSRLLFWRKKYCSILRLAIGAPTSPMLSNILMADFDAKVSAAVAKDNVVYTRYADDLTFSAKRTGNLTGVEKTLKVIIRETKTPRLCLNESKTVLATKKFRRVVTGLVLADNGAVSLGRERKRELSAAVHHFVLGRLNAEKVVKLSGLLAFANSVEPAFLSRLVQKYGADAIARLKHCEHSNNPHNSQSSISGGNS
jgi:RNA-directed DNA polymerase